MLTAPADITYCNDCCDKALLKDIDLLGSPLLYTTPPPCVAASHYYVHYIMQLFSFEASLAVQSWSCRRPYFCRTGRRQLATVQARSNEKNPVEFRWWGLYMCGVRHRSVLVWRHRGPSETRFIKPGIIGDLTVPSVTVISTLPPPAGIDLSDPWWDIVHNGS